MRRCPSPSADHGLKRPPHSVGATMKCALTGLVGIGLVQMLTGDAYADLEVPPTTWCGARQPGRQNRRVFDLGLLRSRATAPLAPLSNTRPSCDPSVPRRADGSLFPGCASPSSASATTTPYLVPHRRVPLQQPSAVCLDTAVTRSRKAPYSCPCPTDDCSQPPLASVSWPPDALWFPPTAPTLPTLSS